MAAIYMWPVEDQILLTTTLYPVEVVDSLALSIVFTTGLMEIIPSDYLEYTQDLLSGTYIQLRWFYAGGLYEDKLEYTQDLLSGTYTQLRWFYAGGLYEDYLEYTQDLLSGTYTRMLVIADTPDEALQLQVAILNTCTMTLI